MRVAKVTLALLERVRGSVEATDDETAYYLAAREIVERERRIQQAPTRPANASDADRATLPSERPGS